MTDKKVASDWPYSLGDELLTTDDCYRTLETETHVKIANLAYAAGHSAGRKAERYRCAKIAENEAGEIPECLTGRIISRKIREGDENERG